MIGVKKKEDVFFDLFCEQMQKVLEVGDYFYKLVHDYTDVAEKAHHIEWMEMDCDKLTHRFLAAVNDAYITPFDREDIYSIVQRLDKVVDYLEKVTSGFIVYDIQEMRPSACRITEAIMQSLRELNIMFENLKDFKKTDVVLKQIIEINRLENEGDHLYRQALKDLFREEKNPVELIKWQRILDQLETAMDTCSMVANVVEGVVMKHA